MTFNGGCHISNIPNSLVVEKGTTFSSFINDRIPDGVKFVEVINSNGRMLDSWDIINLQSQKDDGLKLFIARFLINNEYLHKVFVPFTEDFSPEVVLFKLKIDSYNLSGVYESFSRYLDINDPSKTGISTFPVYDWYVS